MWLPANGLRSMAFYSTYEAGNGFLLTVDSERAAINKQLLQDLCDLVVPATTLGFTNFDDGFVGLAGTVSSLLGVHSQWKKTA